MNPQNSPEQNASADSPLMDLDAAMIMHQSTHAFLLSILGQREAAEYMVTTIADNFGIDGVMGMCTTWINTFFEVAGICNDPEHGHDLSGVDFTPRSVLTGSTVDTPPKHVQWGLDLVKAQLSRNLAEIDDIYLRLAELDPERTFRYVVQLLHTTALNTAAAGARQAAERVAATIGPIAQNTN